MPSPLTFPLQQCSVPQWLKLPGRPGGIEVGSWHRTDAQVLVPLSAHAKLVPLCSPVGPDLCQDAVWVLKSIQIPVMGFSTPLDSPLSHSPACGVSLPAALP